MNGQVYLISIPPDPVKSGLAKGHIGAMGFPDLWEDTYREDGRVESTFSLPQKELVP